MIVFRSQILVFRLFKQEKQQFFRQHTGLTTGIQCAVEVANIYLSELDELMMNAFADSVLVYKRFVDDLFVLWKHEKVEVSQILGFLNGWRIDMVVTREAEDLCGTSFLDVAYELSEVGLHFHTYRKPQNCYLYTPYDSNHSTATLLGIVSTECVRLLRSSQTAAAYEDQLRFFKSKLLGRGFPIDSITGIFSQYPFEAKFKFVHGSVSDSVKQHTNIVPFKLIYSMGAPGLRIGQTLRKHDSIIKDHNVRPLQCYLTSKNLFRRSYGKYR